MAQGTCSDGGCERPAHTRGWCHKHYKQRWRKGSLSPLPTPEEQFWAKIDRRGPNDCWPWTGQILKGYGIFARKLVHRMVYERLVGPIPEGKQLDHLCHNADQNCPGGHGCLHRRCVNPKHLEPATNQENVLRGKTIPARHAAATHCPQGHPYDEANTYHHPKGGRICRECVREASRRYSASHRGERRQYLRAWRARKRAEGAT